MSTRIKICGVRQPQDARAALDAGAQMIGLVFDPGSPRCVGRAEAERVLGVLPAGATPVAVLRDADARHPVLDWWRGAVQLHGNEDETTCAEVRARGFDVIKGFECSQASLARWDACDSLSHLLLDGARPGSGLPPEADLGIDGLAARVPLLRHRVLLAGGLNASNVASRIQAIRPWGVDVSSGVERTRGVKDAALIAEFCRAVASAG